MTPTTLQMSGPDVGDPPKCQICGSPKELTDLIPGLVAYACYREDCPHGRFNAESRRKARAREVAG